MDPVENQTSIQPLPYLVSPPLADANPYWVHRLYLGLTGIAFGEAIDLAQLVFPLLLYFAERAQLAVGEKLIYFLPQVNQISFAITWFSAVYLLAAPEPKSPPDDEGPTSIRRLVIY